MAEEMVACGYYEKPGPENTVRTIELAGQRARALGIQHVLVASTTGATGALAAEMLADLSVIVVSHSSGFSKVNEQELQEEYLERIRAAGASLLTCQHAFGGVGRAVRRKLGSYQIEEIIAFTLRNFSDGIKVCCEISLMATDAGLVSAGDELVASAGTSKGADTAAVILAANAQDFFDLRILEILCKPRRGR